MPQAWRCTHNSVSQSRSSPQLRERALVAEALAEVRGRCEERLHNNQPEWRTGTRGMQPEATAQQESKATADGRHQRDEKQRNNQERGAMRGGSAMRGGGAGGQEAVA